MRYFILNGEGDTKQSTRESYHYIESQGHRGVMKILWVFCSGLDLGLGPVARICLFKSTTYLRLNPSSTANTYFFPLFPNIAVEPGHKSESTFKVTTKQNVLFLQTQSLILLLWQLLQLLS